MLNSFKPETPLLAAKLRELPDTELKDIKVRLVTALEDLLASADVKETDIDEEIRNLDNGSANSDSDDLLQILEKARDVRENRIKVDKEIKRRCPISMEGPPSAGKNQKFPLNSDQSEKSVKIAELKREFDSLMKREEIKNVEELDAIITGKRADLENATKRNNQADMKTAQEELNGLIAIRKTYDQYIKLEEERKQGGIESKIKEMMKRLEEGRRQLKLYEKEEGDLNREHEKLLKAYNYEKVNQPEMAPLTHKQLELAGQLINYEEEIKNYHLQKNDPSYKAPQLSIQEQINEILTKLSLKDKQDFDEQLVFVQSQYDRAIRPTDKAKYQGKLDELKKVADLFKLIPTKLKEEQKWSEQQVQGSQLKQTFSDQKHLAYEELQLQRSSSETGNQKDEEFLSKSIIFAQGVKDMVDCFEKTFFNLFYYACLKYYKEEDKIYSLKIFDLKIKELINNLQKQSEEENISENKVLKNVVNQVKLTENPQQIIQHLIPGIVHIKSFSFHELLSLVSELDVSAQKIKDQDLILLLGTTGSGKSTTAHYLAGSEMRLTKAGTIYHIEPAKIFNPDLKKVRTSWKAKSETRYVTPVQIMHNMRKIILTDTPGTEDTQSAEMEFSNQLGVQKAISQANSVRPVILFSFKNVGDRMEKLKKLLSFYGRLFNNIQQYAKSITYVMTNVTENTRGTIKQQLDNIKSTMTFENQADQIFIEMLNDFINKAEKGDIIEIDPLNSKAKQDVLDRIMQKTPIYYPGDVIKANVSLESYEKVKNQFALHNEVIANALHKQGGDIIIFKLSELKQMNELYPDNDTYKIQFEQCIQKISNYLNDRYDQTTNSISQCFIVNVELTDKVIENYINQYNQMKVFDKCIAIFLQDIQTRVSADYLSALNIIASQVLADLVDSSIPICDKAWFDLIMKLELIEKYFKNFETKQVAFDKFIQLAKKQAQNCIGMLNNREQVIEIAQEYQMPFTPRKQRATDNEQLFQNAESPISQHLQKFRFQETLGDSFSDSFSIQNDFANSLYQVQKAHKRMMKINNICSQNIKKLLDEINAKFEAYITKMIYNSFNVFTKNHLIFTEDHIKKGQYAIDFLAQFKNAFLDNKLIQIESILSQQLLNLQKQLESSIEAQIQHIDSFLIDQSDQGTSKDNKIEKELENKYNNLTLLKQFSLLQTPKIEGRIFALEKKISNYVYSNVQRIGNIFAEIEDRSKRNQKHLSNLKRALQSVKRLQWFESYNEQNYQYTLQNIEEKFIEYISELKSEVQSKKIGLTDLENLQSLAQAQSEINEYKDIIAMTGIQINLQNGIGFDDKLKQINQTIELNEKKIAEYEMIENPLDADQLKTLNNFYDFLQIISEQQQIFKKDNCLAIQIRIKGDEQTSLINKQHKLINQKLNTITNIIDEYINGNSSDLAEKVGNHIDMLESILLTIKDLQTNNPTLFDKFQQLVLNVNSYIFRINNLISQMRSRYQDQTSQQFTRFHDILSRIIFIDQFNPQYGFKNEYESLKQEMLKNPSDNVGILKQLFDLQQYDDMYQKLKLIEDSNRNEFTKAQNMICIQIKTYFQIIAYKPIDEENKDDVAKQIETVKILIQIDEGLNQYISKLNIKQQVSNFINRHLKNATYQLSSCQKFKTQKNYGSAFNCQRIASNVCDMLLQFDESIVDKNQCENLNLQLNNELAELTSNMSQDIEAFKLMDISQYQYNSPKKLNESILKLPQYDISFFTFSQNLKEYVMDHLESMIRKIESELQDDSPQLDEIKKNIIKIEKIKSYLPEDWWQELQMTIHEVKHIIDSKVTEQNEFIDQIQQQNKIDFFIQLLVKNPNLLKNEKQIKWVHNSLGDLIKKCGANIKNIEMVQEGIYQLIEIEKYIHHKDIHKLLSQSENDSFIKLKNQIDELIKETSEEMIKLLDEKQQVNGLKLNPNKVSFSLQMNTSQKQFQFKHIVTKLFNLIQGFSNSEQSQEIKDDSVFLDLQVSLKKRIDKINDAASQYIKLIQQNTFSNINVAKNQVTNDCQKYLSLLFRVDLILINMKDLKIATFVNFGFQADQIDSQSYLIQAPIQQIEQILDNIKKEIYGIELITAKTKQSGQDRKDHYTNIQAIFNTIDVILGFDDEIKSYISHNVIQLKDKCQKALQENIADLIDQTINLSKNLGDQDKLLMASFQEKFAHLKSFEENVTLHRAQIKRSIESIEEGINLKINAIFSNALTQINDIPQFSEGLVKLQRLNENFPSFRENVKAQISDLLKKFKQNSNNDTKQLHFLCLRLRECPEGANLTAEFKYFEGVERSLWNQKVQRIDIEQVLKEIDGDNLDIQTIRSRYQRFERIYKETVELTLKNSLSTKRIDIKPIITNIKFHTNSQLGKWTIDEVDKLPDIMALIFSLWTLTSADNYFEADEKDVNKNNYLRMPHAAQVVSIFRIMGIGYSSFVETGVANKLKERFKAIFGIRKAIVDNLVQIKTGEGKSITLAVVSIIFALYGFGVRVACYSEYLSNRDYNAFEDLFKALEVQDNIKYGTFNQACEAYINKDGKIRDIYLSKILKSAKGVVAKAPQKQRPLVLMIDEVDVFFSKDFYGQQYRPSATIQDSSVAQLLDYIWSIRSDPKQLNMTSIKNSMQFQQCNNIFIPAYAFLLEEAVKDMICDVQDFHLHDYILENGMIGYKDQDQISFNVSFGYKTTFAYYQQHSEGKISKETLEKQKTIGINCGEFSYSEIPINYSIILGVTGTLKQLSVSEKYIIQNVYYILNQTYSPSVYGNTQLKWEPREDLLIIDKSRYFIEIINEINARIKNFSRAVIVFFNNDKNLQLFLSSQEFQNQAFPSVQVLNERLSFDEKEDAIKMASRSGYITLATRSFGRGADFICKDSKVEENGGVHVLLTFFSTEVSEEVQLLGRTARQGNKGSISMVLLIDDLSQFNITEKDTANYMRTQHYQMLCDHRNILQSNIQKNETQSLQDKSKAHKLATAMCELALKGGNDSQIIQFLKQNNLGRTKGKVTKTLIMMDATGSMSNLIIKAKNAVSAMFEEASQILIDKNINPKLFEIQFGCYRNYTNTPQELLQYSSWESNPQSLKKFMETIKAHGGYGAEEAVEIGLWHANQEADTQENGSGISQVFIIGDAPPNTEAMVEKKRKANIAQLEKSKFREKTFYQWEAKKLKAKGIQVYTFYVIDYAKAVFEEIATTTGGKCQFLDVNSDMGQKILVKLFVTEILRKVGNENGGQGEQLVEAYKAYKQASD